MKSEFLMLAQTYNPKKHFIGGWLMSEKLDGMRCFWDGGVSRELKAIHVPWANTNKDKSIRYSTGLWSRYGKIISAPDWFLDELPPVPLDGELWCGYHERQKLLSAVKPHIPDTDLWKRVKYMVFDSPKIERFLESRQIRNSNMVKCIPDWAKTWWISRGGNDGVGLNYAKELVWVKGLVEPVEHIKLPMSTAKLEHVMSEFLDDIVGAGGEGIMLRNPRVEWYPERSWNLMKFKPLSDGEARVVGFTWGKETDKGSKHLGRMGGLIVRENDVEFTVSGFNDAEREILYNGKESTEIRYPEDSEYTPYRWWPYGESVAGCRNEDMAYVPKEFPIGSIITFKYNGRTDDGVPVEARYWRKWEAI